MQSIWMELLNPELWQYDWPRLAPSIGLTVALGFTAWGIRAVTLGGAMTGVALTVLLCLGVGPRALLPVLCLFTLTMLATRLGYKHKQQNGFAEPRGGRRARQVLANVGVAVLCALPFMLFPSIAPGLLLVGTAAALAEAAADTVASEIGQYVGGKTVLITNLQPVDPGAEGGITAMGTAAGFVAAGVVAWSCVWANILSPRWFLLVLTSATVGMCIDSLLGATLEEAGRIGNDAVNYAGTASAAFIALAWSFALQIS